MVDVLDVLMGRMMSRDSRRLMEVGRELGRLEYVGEVPLLRIPSFLPKEWEKEVRE